MADGGWVGNGQTDRGWGGYVPRGVVKGFQEVHILAAVEVSHGQATFEIAVPLPLALERDRAEESRVVEWAMTPRP